MGFIQSLRILEMVIEDRRILGILHKTIFPRRVSLTPINGEQMVDLNQDETIVQHFPETPERHSP